ncbi:lipase secretion chaperone [Psychrobacter sp. DM4]|uniref:lipase secretion chaperone n=1 Tax=Psychrobacter sp. DM4 TaxID=3440637 RepID=UPI003F50AC97
MSKKYRVPYFALVIIAIVIAVTIAVILWFKPDKSAATVLADTSTTVSNGSTNAMTDMSDPYNGLEVSSTQTNTEFTTGLERLPSSLQGTQVDGEIIIDDNKQLVVTEGLRRLFDYFLSAMGEEDEATILARVESYIRHHTPEPAASQAVAIFNQYVSYLKQLSKIEASYGNLQLQATKAGALDLNVVGQRKQDVSNLRKQIFDDETIKAFFSSDDSYDEYSVAMLEIEQNQLMSDMQKNAARQDYVSRMPDGDIKSNIKQQANIGELIERTEQMKAKGASAQELYNMRRELVGAPAATRLAKIDVEDANFDQRFMQYQAQKQQLLTQNPDNAQIQINQLEQQLFDDAERKRLTGYAALKQESLDSN